MMVNYNKTIKRKEADNMPTENERKDVQKAMAYDLIRIFEANPQKAYDAAELKKLIDAYITGTQQ